MQSSNFKKHSWIVALVIIAITLSLGTFTVANSEQRSPGGLWLSDLVGQKVVVSFITVPPDLGRFESLQLMAVDCAGIVVSFPNNDVVFLSFANIMSIERDPN